MANVPSSPIVVTLMMEALSSSEMSFLTRTTGHDIPEDDILHSRRRENLNSYIPTLRFLPGHFSHMKILVASCSTLISYPHCSMVKNGTEEWCLLGCYAMWLL
jgi:hypothetical protein